MPAGGRQGQVSTLRLAAHIHSSFSDDCDWPLERIVRLLQCAGYHGALVCEHDRGMTNEHWRRIRLECDRLTQAGFLTIPGIEYQDPSHTVHVPVYGDIPFLGSSPHVADVLRRAADHGGVSVIAHPARRDAFRTIREEWLDAATGIEIWNRKYDGIRPNAWAMNQTYKHELVRFVSLDFHGPRQFFPLALTVPADGAASSVEILAMIRSGASRPSALGIDPELLMHGAGGTIFSSLEIARRRLAAVVRSAEGEARRILERRSRNRGGY